MAFREKLANVRFLSNATQNYILDHQCQVQSDYPEMSVF